MADDEKPCLWQVGIIRSFSQHPGWETLLLRKLSGNLQQSCIVPRLILETDAQTIAGRVTMRGAEGEVPLAEQVPPCGLLRQR